MQGFDVVWGRVPGHFLDGRTRARLHRKRAPASSSIRLPEGHMQIGWVIAKGTFGDLKKMGAGGWIGALAPHVSPDLRNFLAANKTGLAHPFLLDAVCDRLREWTAPGLLLIGDAAHPMSPVGAQGINVALRDAVVAANRLGRALVMRCRRGHARFCGAQCSGRAMARDRDATGLAAGRAALRGVEFAPEPHRRERADDRVRETFPRRRARAAIRSVPARRHPRRDGAVSAVRSFPSS